MYASNNFELFKGKVVSTKIPNDFILFISGISCVGKTAVAQRIVTLIPEFRNVTEMDILRTAARSIVEDSVDLFKLEKRNLVYEALFCSTKAGDFTIYKQQASFFVTSVRNIVKRQQTRKIPTIIEGINIVPSLYFSNYTPIEGFKNHILFVNLYLSDELSHIERRSKRCHERGYVDTEEEIVNTVKCIRNHKNEELHNECQKLSRHVNNVFSIDTTAKNIDDVTRIILELIYNFST